MLAWLRLLKERVGIGASAGGWKNKKKEGAKWGEKDAASLYRLHTKTAIQGTKGGGA